MITSREYFNITTQIPHTTDNVPNSNLVGNKVQLEEFIQKYEKDLLIKVFGYSLYKEFMSNFDYDSQTMVHTLNVGAAQKWHDLLTGKEYTLNGKQVLWPGILFEDGDISRSFISNYVSWYFTKQDRQKYMGIGLVISKSKNSETIRDWSEYMVNIWNEFVDMVNGEYCFNSESTGDYGSGIRSLYQYLNDMKKQDPTIYPDWSPYNFKKVNIFSI